MADYEGADQGSNNALFNRKGYFRQKILSNSSKELRPYLLTISRKAPWAGTPPSIFEPLAKINDPNVERRRGIGFGRRGTSKREMFGAPVHGAVSLSNFPYAGSATAGGGPGGMPLSSGGSSAVPGLMSNENIPNLSFSLGSESTTPPPPTDPEVGNGATQV